jgi:hypothetical protein
MTDSIYARSTDLFRRIANTELVTVTISRQTVTPVENVTALRMALSRTDMFVMGGFDLQGNEQVWEVVDADLAGGDIKVGDYITDSTNVGWKVISSQRLVSGSRWHCICQKQGR